MIDLVRCEWLLACAAAAAQLACESVLDDGLPICNVCNACNACNVCNVCNLCNVCIESVLDDGLPGSAG